MPHVLLKSHPPCFETRSTTGRVGQAGLPIRKPQGFICPHFPSAEITSVWHHTQLFPVCAGDQSHTCMASTLAVCPLPSFFTFSTSGRSIEESILLIMPDTTVCCTQDTEAGGLRSQVRLGYILRPSPKQKCIYMTQLPFQFPSHYLFLLQSLLLELRFVHLHLGSC